MNIKKINNLILEEKQLKNISTKEISDGHHTFGDLYKHRTILFCTICNMFPQLSWKSKHHFNEKNDPMFNDSFICGINTPKGVAAYHIKNEYWDLFNIQEIEKSPKYGNYKDEDVLERILSLTNR